MISKKRVVLAVVAACAMVLATTAGTKNPVERPFRGQAIATWVINLADGSSTTEQITECTHIGRSLVTGSAIWDLQSMTILSGHGVTITASGEECFWVLGGQYEVTLTGGTGRFAGVTGGFNTVSQSEPLITVDPVAGTITLTLSYTTVGRITY